jgi:hypothetical protein
LQVTLLRPAYASLGAINVYEAGGKLLYTGKPAEIISGSNVYLINVPLNYLATSLRLYVTVSNSGGTASTNATEVIVWQKLSLVYAQNFGTLASTAQYTCTPDGNPGFQQYIGSGYTCSSSIKPNAGQYVLLKRTTSSFAEWNQGIYDHTTGISISGYSSTANTGLMAVFNCAKATGTLTGAASTLPYGINGSIPTVLYSAEIDNLCVNTDMYVSFWALSNCLSTKTPIVPLSPHLAILITDTTTTGTPALLASIPANPDPSTGNFIVLSNGVSYWQQFSVALALPPGQNAVRFQIVNYNADDNGNDMSIDDIEVYTVPSELSVATANNDYYDPGYSNYITFVYPYSIDNGVSPPVETMDTVSITVDLNNFVITGNEAPVFYWVYNTSVNFNLLNPSTWTTAPMRLLPNQSTNTLTGLARLYQYVNGIADTTGYVWTNDTVQYLPAGYYRLVAGAVENFGSTPGDPNSWSWACLAVSDPIQLLIDEADQARVFYNPGIGSAGTNAAIINNPYLVQGTEDNGTCTVDPPYIALPGDGLIPPDGMYFLCWRDENGGYLYAGGDSVNIDPCTTAGVILTAQYAAIPQLTNFTCEDSIILNSIFPGYEAFAHPIYRVQITDSVFVVLGLDVSTFQDSVAISTPGVTYTIENDSQGFERLKKVEGKDTTYMYGRPDMQGVLTIYAHTETGYVYVDNTMPAPENRLPTAIYHAIMTLFREVKVVNGIPDPADSDGTPDPAADALVQKIIYRIHDKYVTNTSRMLLGGFYNTDGSIVQLTSWTDISIYFTPKAMMWTPQNTSQDFNDWRNWTICNPLPEIDNVSQDADGFYIGYYQNNLTGSTVFGVLEQLPGLNDQAQFVPWSCTDIFIPANATVFPDLTSGATDYNYVSTSVFVNEDSRAVCRNVYFDYQSEVSAEIKRSDMLIYESVFVKLAGGANRWHMLSAPLQQMYAGDFYSQHRNPLKDNLPDGRPLLVLTRLHQTSNPQTGKFESDALGFTGTFNNPGVEIPVGTGFAVWFADGMPITQHDSCEMWFPKNDPEHNIWNTGGWVVSTIPVVRGAESRFTYEKGNAMTLEGYISLQASASQAGDYALIGNPFMASWNFEKFVTENNADNITMRYAYLPLGEDGRNDNVSSFTWVDGTNDWADDSNKWIAPWQAVIVEAKQAFTSLTTHVSDVSEIQTDDSGTRRARAATSVPEDRLKIRAAKDGRENTTTLLYNILASNSYDLNEDCKALFVSNVTAPVAVYSRSAEGRTLDINRFSDVGQFIWLGVRTSTTGKIRLDFEGLDDFLPDYDIFINDVKTGSKVNLRLMAAYEFDKDNTDLFMDERLYLSFELQGGGSTDLNAIEKSQEKIRITVVGKELKITGNSNLHTVEVFDMMGRRVAGATNINTPVYSTRLNGVQFYIVKVNTANASVVEKVRVD